MPDLDRINRKTNIALLLAIIMSLMSLATLLIVREIESDTDEIIDTLDIPTPGPIIIVRPGPGGGDPASWEIKEGTLTLPAEFGRSREMRKDALGTWEQLKATWISDNTEHDVRQWSVRVRNLDTDAIHTIKATRTASDGLTWTLDDVEVKTCKPDTAGDEGCEGDLPEEFNGEWLDMTTDTNSPSKAGKAQASSP